MSRSVATIVEGHAEVESVPLLLRRIFAELGAPSMQVARPFRIKRNRVVKEGELERAIRQTILDRNGVAGIMILLDSDDDCPAELGVQLLARAMKTTSIPVSVVLAHREFESWFLGAKESLRGINGIADDATAPIAPETIRGAKEHLTRNMTGGRRYLAVDDQVRFTDRFDMSLARLRCPSFDKCFRDAERLIHEIGALEDHTARVWTVEKDN